MKSFLIVILLMMSQLLYAGCESTLLEGSHTAIKKKDAQIGAWEEAKDACYPGDATKLGMQCQKVSGDKGVQGKKAERCVQEVSCNLCDDDLSRKYEALD